MAYWNLAVEGGEGGGHRGRRVAVDQHDIGFHFVQDIPHAGQHPGGDVIQVLSLFHDVQVIVGLHPENLQHLVQHLPVLAAYADKGFELFGMLLELLDQRTHLDGLRPGSENE